MKEKKTGGIFATLPHVISNEEFETRTIRRDMNAGEETFWQFQQGLNVNIPIKAFLVQLHCSKLKDLIAGEDPPVRAEMKIENTGASAMGKWTPDFPDYASFVFFSNNGEEVVREGDKIVFNLFDKEGNDLISMGFPVLREDLEEFSKTISCDFLETLLKST